MAALDGCLDFMSLVHLSFLGIHYYDFNTAQLEHVTLKISFNQKVLLHDRKRHTTCRVTSTYSSVSKGRWGTLVSARGYPYPLRVTPAGWDWGTLGLGLGYPTRKYQGPKTRGKTWDWGTPKKGPGTRGQGKNMNWSTPPPPVDRQTDTCENITFPSYFVSGQ